LEVIEAIVKEVRAVPGVVLLDYSSDKDHNRTVVTFIGEPEAAKEAAFAACKKAAELIDMDEHTGEHPRMGATDVIPFVPVKDITMEECVTIAENLAQRISEELGVPTYLYEQAAKRPERKNLANVRKGQYEGLKELINTPEREPDFGPKKLPKAGATAVGARMPLIAFNVNLGTGDLQVAKNIAKLVRGSSGGLVNVKAMGVMLEERNIAQVSMNMVNYIDTSLYRVFELIKAEAKRYGVNVIGSEIVGLVPMDALIDAAEYYLQIENFSRDQVLEKRIFE
jgi:glutamate formiminotransferase